MIRLDEIRGMHLPCRFPCVVTFRVPPPFNQVFQALAPSMTSVAEHALHFVLLLSFQEVRWWSREVRAVGGRLSIGGQQRGVEYIVYPP